jgi:tripartite-type tricarboxylate transporter receptor subunit TctC
VNTGTKAAQTLQPTCVIAADGKSFNIYSWDAAGAASGTARDIINKIADDIAKVASGSTFKERVTSLGMEAVGNRPEEFNKYIREEIVRWGRIIRERKITAQ